MALVDIAGWQKIDGSEPLQSSLLLTSLCVSCLPMLPPTPELLAAEFRPWFPHQQ